VTADDRLFPETMARAQRIVDAEWRQFQRVQGDDGRAACQDDWKTFRQMRLAQFLAWSIPLLDSYEHDLSAAESAGRNLLTEKYGRMMSSTEPARYTAEIAPRLPVLPAERIERHERVIARQVGWAAQFHGEYPCLGASMRVLRTADDTLAETSFETYLRGELGTYSDATFDLYEALVRDFEDQGRNLTERILSLTVAMSGYPDLESAEAAQRA